MNIKYYLYIIVCVLVAYSSTIMFKLIHTRTVVQWGEGGAANVAHNSRKRLSTLS